LVEITNEIKKIAHEKKMIWKERLTIVY
jgi:hypothetical protein